MQKEKVVVGLSGGVDSALTAWLLIQEGYEVEGLFMRNWDSATNNDFLGHKVENEVCVQEQDYQDALKVAKQLKIKLHRINFVQEYWDDVFRYFLSEYEQGRTPNPDIFCNKYIKFDRFLNYALTELKADKIAMGHYAGVKFNPATNQFELLKPKDKEKDQTYFLAQLSQWQLAKTLFPLQNYLKTQVRALAKKIGLSNAQKKDSTGICFIGEREFQKFLQNYIPNQPGMIVDIQNQKPLGQHVGVMYYTLGQRKGLNLSGMSEPYYVARKDVASKTLFVAPAHDLSYLMSQKTEVNQINWIVNLSDYVTDPTSFEAMAKFRYRQVETKVKVQKMDNQRYLVEFATPLKAVTPGQQAVFYLQDVTLGGGIIDKTS